MCVWVGGGAIIVFLAAVSCNRYFLTDLFLFCFVVVAAVVVVAVVVVVVVVVAPQLTTLWFTLYMQ